MIAYRIKSIRSNLFAFLGSATIGILLLGAGTTLYAQCDQVYDWATWTSFSGNSASGTIISNGQPIDVTMTANYTFDSTPNIYNYAAFNGFGGPLPPNATVPRTTWAAGQGGETTMCFSETVENPALLLSSVGNPGLPVTLEFSQSYIVIYDGGGMTYPNDMTIIGQEGYAIIVFPGDFDCVTIYSDTPENYTNITWGLNPPLFEVDVVGDTIACESTTLTASGGVSYEWSGGEDPYSASNTFTESGTYLLTVTDDMGCTVVTSVNVEIHPVADTLLEAAICEGEGYDFYGQYLTQAGQYTEVLQTEFDCDSTITLNLSVNPLMTTDLYEEICEGDIYFFNGDAYAETGTYAATLQSEFGCDSTVTLYLLVHDLGYTEIFAEICEGDFFEFDGSFLTTPGSYYASFFTEFGCDSTVLLTLEVHPSTTTNLFEEICAGETYFFNGNNVSESGNYQASYTNEYGCDSLVTLDLIVHPATTANSAATICMGESYLFHGDTLTQAGSYSVVLQNQFGCDSILTLNLTTNSSSSSYLDVAICAGETYVFDGQILSTSGSYSVVLQNQLGCDSVLTLTLTVHPVLTTPINVQICEGQVYSFQGADITNPGIYTANLQSALGCDSTVQLTLSVVDVIESEIITALCDGESYSFGGLTLNSSGTYVDTLISVGGCDSIATLQLSFNAASDLELAAVICEGENYAFNGQTLTSAGQYIANLKNSSGCDSIVTLTLQTIPAKSTSLDVQLCTGEGYSFNGDHLITPGLYTANLQSVSGCDSIVQLMLSVVSSKETDISAAICQGSTYVFGGQVLSQGGIYMDSLVSASGCDSLVTLTLIVNTPVANNSAVTICDGEAYAFNGELLTVSGQYTATLQSASGCDSIVVLDLEVGENYTLDIIASDCDSFTWPLTQKTYFQSGIYPVAFTSIHGCDSIHRLVLTIHPSFSVNQVATSYKKYIWPVNNKTYTHSGNYVEKMQSINGCDSIITLQLVIDKSDNLYIPNAFSPNDDGINDKFTIYGDEHLVMIEDLSIYDRWGNYLSQFTELPPNNPEFGWDGKRDNRPMDPGVYVYTALLRFEDGTITLYSGDITIVK